MKLLIDTQALIWFATSSPSLTSAATAAMSNPENVLSVSAAALWEIGIKVSIGKLRLPLPIGDFIKRAMEGYGIALEPILPVHIEIISLMPFHHKDPFDRIIAAQARCDGFSVVSSDPCFDFYGVPRIW